MFDRRALASALLALTIAIGVAAPRNALAFTVGGAVERASEPGVFVRLEASSDLVVGEDTFDDANLYAFDEDQNILLERDLAVDIGAAGRTIPAGTVVASHYVFFDPGWGAFQTGYVEFDAPILGVATSQETLKASDFLANTDVVYLNPILRGLEWEDRVWIDPDDPHRVRVSWLASSPGDYIRVFTARSPGV